MPREPGAAPFGDLLREYRVRAGLSQEELAERAQLSLAAVGALERGIRHTPYRSTVTLLAKALRLSEEDSASLELVRKSGHDHSTKTDIFSHLHTPRTSFVGRDTDIAQLVKLLGKSRLVTVTGSGGIGKTRVAIEALRCLASPPWDEAWFVDLAPLTDGGFISTKIASSIQPPLTDRGETLAALVSALAKRHMLLIFDNCEHIVTEAAHAADTILEMCPRIAILATSREPLNIAGEFVYRLPSLSLPERAPKRLDRAGAYSAVDLFVQRAEAADPRAKFDADDLAAIVNVARRLDGMPLAIELAAARLPMLGLQTLQTHLDDHFNIPGARRDLPPRQQTVIATIRWSYDLLSDLERTLFRKLSIFAGGFTLENATAVCSEGTIDEIVILDLLSSLVDKSLVQAEFTERGTRYRLLESMRQYARKRLAECGEYTIVASTHATAFLKLAEELGDARETTPDRVWDARAGLDLENFRAALAWAFGAQGDVQIGQRLAGTLHSVWGIFGVAEGRRWLQTAREAADAQTPVATLAALDLAEAYLAATLAQHKESLAAAERALLRYREVGDPRRTAHAQRWIGRALVLFGSIAEGEALLTQALEGARRLGVGRLTSSVLETLAIARRNAGDPAGARQYLAEALTIARSIGAERTAALVAMDLAEVEFRGGDAAAALRLAAEELAVHRAFDDARNVALALCNMAAYQVALERYDDARVSAREGLAVARDTQVAVCVAFMLQHLAAIAALRYRDTIT